MATQIRISDMRAAGKNGYVAKIIKGEKYFQHPVERSGYGTSRQILTFALKEDGLYEICDANFGSRKRSIYFIKLENEEIVRSADHLSELIVEDNEYPQLEGSYKQVAWAESIRQNFVAKLKQTDKKIPSWVNTQVGAKFWIDNRQKLGG